VRELRRYIFQLTFLSIACLITGYVVLRAVFPEYYFPLYPYMVVFFFLLGSITIFSIQNVTKKENSRYFNVFMIIKMIKLLSIVTIAGAYALFVRENTISFLFTFFAYYLIYSIYEAYVSMKLNKAKNEITQG